MSELVNEYHPAANRSSTKREKGNNPAQTAYAPPDSLNSDGRRFVSRQFQDHDLIPEIDNPSLELMLEQELCEVKGDPVNEVAGVEYPPQTTTDERLESTRQQAAQKFEKACFDLIKETQQNQAAPVEEDFDQDLADVLARNLNGQDQFDAAAFKETPAANYNQVRPARVFHEQNTPVSSFWTWRAALGSALMLITMVAGGVFMSTQGVSGISEEIARVAKAVNPVQPQSTTGTAEKETAGSLLSGQLEGSEVLHGAEFASAPVPAVIAVENWQEGVLDRMQTPAPAKQADTERAIEIKSLNVKLNVVQAHLGSLQLAYSVTGPDRMPKLLEETARAQGEISSLENQIATLKPRQAAAQTSRTGGTVKTLRVIPKGTVPGELANTGLASAGGDDNSSIARTSSNTPKARNPEAVELALASTPGLYLLEQSGRDALKTKLINGECLVPALSSVFTQVPVLVMRDMVQKLDGQC